MTLAQAYLIHQTTNRTLPCGLIDYIHRCGNLGINRLIVMCKIRQEIFFNDLNPSRTSFCSHNLSIKVLSKTACISFVLIL